MIGEGKCPINKDVPSTLRKRLDVRDNGDDSYREMIVARLTVTWWCLWSNDTSQYRASSSESKTIS